MDGARATRNRRDITADSNSAGRPVQHLAWRVDQIPGAGADLKTRIVAILRNERHRELGRIRQWTLAAALVAAVAGPILVGLLTERAAAAQEANSFQGLATLIDRKFEIASIKPSDVEARGSRLGPPGGGSITIVNYPLRNLIAQAFRTTVNMVASEPDWTRDTRYDIAARGPDPTVDNPVVWEMMRSLLIDRFHLKYHIEQREMPVFELRIASSGHKLTLGEHGRCAEAIKAGATCGDILVPPFGTGMHNMPIGALIIGIGARAGRPVVDKTGLTGRYDIIVPWLPDGMKFEELSSELRERDPRASIEGMPAEFRPQDMTLQQALEAIAGLRLEPARAAMPVVVVDSISRPDPD